MEVCHPSYELYEKVSGDRRVRNSDNVRLLALDMKAAIFLVSVIT